jgi:hypothetical protein
MGLSPARGRRGHAMINHTHESRIADLHRRRQQALTAGGADRIAKQHGNIPL